MPTLLLVAIVGFVAQLIDGAIGMAFGITSMTVLLAVGYAPAASSAVVHFVKIGTGIASGGFHLWFGNVDKRALFKVALPGGVGAFVGAMLLSSVDFTAASPWTSVLLLGLGVLILIRFSRASILGVTRRARARWLMPLGLVGGFVDATGGGGWGPIVTTTLTASNALTPRKAIGTTNTAEILVALAASVGFLVGIGANNIAWDAVLALMLGGLVGAPIAAKLVSVAPQRILGLVTGTVVVLLNSYSLAVSLAAPEPVALVVVCVGLVACAAVFWFGLRIHLAEIREMRRIDAQLDGGDSDSSGENELEQN